MKVHFRSRYSHKFLTVVVMFIFQALWFPFKSDEITKAGKFQVVNYIDKGIKFVYAIF